jgi:prepilin-type N-terminal cleavage/methylation domain-containing protein
MFFKKLKEFKERAFTFLEVVIVVFIVSILAAVILPSLFRSSVNSYDDDARMVASVLRYAKDRAQFSMSQVLINIDLDRKTLSFDREGKKEVKKIDSLHAVKVTSSKKKLSGKVTITFPDSGLSERITVRLTANSGFLDVICNPYSGKVTIEKAIQDDLDEISKS